MKTLLFTIAVLLGMSGSTMAESLSFDLLGNESPALLDKPVQALDLETAKQQAVASQKGLVVCRGVDIVAISQSLSNSDRYVVAVVADNDSRYSVGMSYYKLSFRLEKIERPYATSSSNQCPCGDDCQCVSETSCADGTCNPAPASRMIQSRSRPRSVQTRSCSNGTCR